MISTQPRIIALAPRGAGGAAIAIAGSRAGGLGMLDLEGLAAEAATRAIETFTAFGDQIGIRIDASTVHDGWFDCLPPHVCGVCCIADRAEAWKAAVSRVAESGRFAMVEVTTREVARLAKIAGASGAILTGNEAGGRCAVDSSFVLLQAVIAECDLPVWVRGGIGIHSAAACVAAGAAGVVLDGALLLSRESPLDEKTRETIARFDGTESVVVTAADHVNNIRVYAPPGSSVQSRIKSDEPVEVGWSIDQAWPIGQDSAFAASLAKRFVTTGGIVQACDASIDRGIELARLHRPLAPGSLLAKSHGTRFPVVQGPMTRVSDNAAFAEAVANEGGLPFLALAMLRGPQLRELLADASARLSGRPWGVGILGFVTPELRVEQIEAVRAVHPPFVLIAGGRPDQARELEDQGIHAYLHAPSPELLGQYLKGGARRFVLEGRECGGHVGPRSSLVLWEQAAAKLLEFSEKGNSLETLHILFAGGIHDARSSASIAALSAPLAAKGAKIGVLIGTAYLFTDEAVQTGAIVARFRDEAIRCRNTVLLQTGPGHEIRVANSPFVDAFANARLRMIAAGQSNEEIRVGLEKLNVGRLRVASKGVERAEGASDPLISLDDATQYERGVYMLGQVATLRDENTTIAALHRSVSEGCEAHILTHMLKSKTEAAAPEPSDIAIVGLSAIMPGAGDARTFWENTLQGLDAITEIPPDRWDWRTYYDPDPKAPDKVVSKWGGFVPDIPFDPLRYGMPPSSLTSIEPVQLLVLEAVRHALDDAGYSDRPFPRERTAVVLGMGGGAAQLAMGYAFRSYLPMLESVAPEAGKLARDAAEQHLPEWTEDSFPGFLLNVAAGRVANRFDLHGSNFTVDAACGSSLAAASLAVRELETGAADIVVLGGADTVQNPLTYLAFSKTQAFSPRGRCRPFDASADGIVISEGVGVVILKRLADAERDGDRIYAVIKGVGTSSDGRARGLTAPNVDGQTRALKRAYEKANVDPSTLGYVEAHGTGTAVGDVVEFNALSSLLREAGTEPVSCSIGSVKSMIGHTKCAAGLAGLINATLALHHKVLPPTRGVDSLNPKADLADGPLKVSTKPRPWFHSEKDRSRRAGVSAFGFGGTNFHLVLEAYDRGTSAKSAPSAKWPAELLLWRGETPAIIAASLDKLISALDNGSNPRLRDLAHSLAARFDAAAVSQPTLAIVATTLDDLKSKIATARKAIERGETQLSDPSGIEYSARPAFAGEKIAFLFPGQGSQTLEMLGDLAFACDEVREAIEEFDRSLKSWGRAPISPKIFPPTTLDATARERAREVLMATEIAQPAVGAVSVGMFRLLQSLEIAPDLLGGHSYGELVALHAAGCYRAEGLAQLSDLRGRLMREACGKSLGAMAAVAASAEQVAAILDGSREVVIANHNGPKQTVVSGPRDAVIQFAETVRTRGLRVVELPVACAFHSSAVASASRALTAGARTLITSAPDRPVFANLDAAAHPADHSAIAERLGSHIASPVRFGEMVAAMHSSGARAFVEVGPGAVLTPLVTSILADKPHIAVSTDAPSRPGLPTLLRTLAKLAVSGVHFRPARLTSGRDVRSIDPERLPVGDGSPPLPASTWLVNGSRARPLGAPEVRRLGQAPNATSSDPTPPRPSFAPTTNGRVSQVKISRKHVANISQSMNNHTNHSARSNGQSEHSIPQETRKPSRNGHAVAEASSRLSAERNGHAKLRVETAITDSARVMEAFQATMQEFLRTQQATMLAYLGQRGTTGNVDPSLTRQTQHSQEASLDLKANSRFAPTQKRSSAFDDSRSDSGLTRVHSYESPSEPVSRMKVGTHERIPGRLVGSTETESTETDRGETQKAISPYSREAIAERLVAIVRDRTGYPPEILKLELDLEADLGIDSIKRVEIIGTLRETVEGLEVAADTSLIDQLARARTLGEIVNLVSSALAAHQGQPSESSGDSASPTPAQVPKEAPSHVKRLTLDTVDVPLTTRPAGLMRAGLVIVTDDGRGVAGAIGEKLRSQGCQVAIASPERMDFSSPAAIEKYLAEVRSKGPIAGIIHALPLRNAETPRLDPDLWKNRMAAEVKGLFLLARAAASDLEHASRNGGACLISATAMGGAFASVGTLPDDFFPGQGGIAGLIKTLAREWPEVRARVVDLDPNESANRLADHLAAEAWTDDGWSEVGYLKGRRVRLQAVATPLDASTSTLSIAQGEPILITGGARGITAAVAEALALRWKPTLLLLGTSPAPSDEEDPRTAGLAIPAELKTTIHKIMSSQGRNIGPIDIECAYAKLIKERQIRANFRALRRAGATVEYARADVRDAETLAFILTSWRKQFGDPVGLIHGAGVIHDKLLRDKTPESFDRVLATKLDGALNLARLLRTEPLRFAAFFSSVAGRFGNKGQSDYAAANEVLNKLAVWLDRRMKGRVVSVNWGPWSGVGMVSELESHLGRRGLGMIAPEVGREAMLDELTSGPKGVVEVIVAGELGSLEEPLHTSSRAEQVPR